MALHRIDITWLSGDTFPLPCAPGVLYPASVGAAYLEQQYDDLWVWGHSQYLDLRESSNIPWHHEDILGSIQAIHGIRDLWGDNVFRRYLFVHESPVTWQVSLRVYLWSCLLVSLESHPPALLSTLYFAILSSNLCRRGDALAMLLFQMLSRGLWSVSSITFLP